MKKKNFEYDDDLIESVKSDFLQRQKLRKNFEAIWQLNNNFLMGNQYSTINMLSEVEDYDKQYFWQEREVFNHIAPIIDARLAKLGTVRPQMNVMPASSDDKDVKIAKLSKDILNSVYSKLNLNNVITQATQWSEISGTSFYKIVWNSNSGRPVFIDQNKMQINEGEVEIVAVPPYEIFPESSCCGSLDDCSSLIHAKAYNTKDIKNIWGVEVMPEDVDVFSLSTTSNVGGLGYKGASGKVINSVKHDHAIVIERYEAPTTQYPNGRLVIVCQNKLLFVGDLPYKNLHDEKRGFPFVRQVSIEQPGCFWGSSVIERIIPVQRAYNAVKNRKHEYLNRISMGVLTVEDGSVDTENLEEEGLSPGKVLIYRQGSHPPQIMSSTSIPSDFENEEDKLLSEFSEISGISNIMTSSTWATNLSGTALELMLEQDSSRLTRTTDNIKNAVKEMSKQILALYKQFAVTPRLLRVSNTNGNCDIYYWSNSDVSCEDIEFSTEKDLGESLSFRREQILKLLDAGLLFDDNGKINKSAKTKILELFGLGVFEGSVDINALQKNYADSENIKLLDKPFEVEVLEIDDHQIHIDSHISFMLNNEFQNAKKQNPLLKELFLSHIKKHKEITNLEN